MKKWVQKKLLERHLQQELLNEYSAEAEALKQTQRALEDELTYTDKIHFEFVNSINFNGDLAIYTTEKTTYPVRLTSNEEFSNHLKAMIPNDIKNINCSLVQLTASFEVKIANPGFSRLLPTLPNMQVINDNLVLFKLDFTDSVNINELRSLIAVIVGNVPIVQDDTTFQSVLKNTLHYLSSKAGCILHSPTLDTIQLNTTRFTQIRIVPVEFAKEYKPLYVTLNQFYLGELEESIKAYVKEIIEYVSVNKLFDQLTQQIELVLKNNRLGDSFQLQARSITKDKFVARLIPSNPKLAIIQLAYDLPLMLTNRELYHYLESDINSKIVRTINQYFEQKASMGNQLKFALPKKHIIISEILSYRSGNEVCTAPVSDLDNLIKCVELELFLLNYYSTDAIGKLKFLDSDGYNIHEGWIGIKGMNMNEVKSAFLKPFQMYQQFLYISEYPYNETPMSYDWCNFILSVETQLVEIQFDKYDKLSIVFDNGYRIEY